MTRLQAARALRGAVVLITAAVIGAAPAAPRAAAVAVELDKKTVDEASTVSYVLQSVLRQSPRVEYVDLVETARGDQATSREQTAAKADKVFKAGLSAYENLDLEPALERFRETVTLYEETDLSETMPGLLRALAMLASTQYLNGDVDGARRSLTRLLSIKADFVLDPRVFTPDLQEMAETIRAEVQAERRNPLEIQVQPVPARVYVDGVFRGISPVVLRDLTPIEHYVTVEALGYAFVQEKHPATPGRIAKVALKPAARGKEILAQLTTLRSGIDSGEVSLPASTLAKWANLAEILVAGVQSASEGIRVLAARVAADGHVLATGEVTVGAADPQAMAQVAQFAMKLYAQDLPRGPGGAPIAKRLGPSFEISRQTVGYALGGAGIASLAAGTFFAIQAQQKATEAKQTPQVNQDAIGVLSDEARTNALVADSLFAVGLIGAGVGVFLALPRGASEPGGKAPDDPFSFMAFPLSDGGLVTIGGRF